MNNNSLIHEKKIAILMGTYNGAAFIEAQLESLAIQTYKNWSLIVSDDGSTDNTIQILRAFQKKWGQSKIEIHSGPMNGFAHNFLALACNPRIRADYYAFCDQDDIWLPDKLSSAVTYLEHLSIDKPALYCGRTNYIDFQGKFIGQSKRFVNPKTFRNALVQSVAGGNTMVFSHSLKILLELIGPQDIASHDWWLYLITTGVGGVVIYDQKPQVEYRQHAGSLVGQNRSFIAKLKRAKGLISGRYQKLLFINLKSLESIRCYLTEENAQIIDQFIILKNSSIKDRFSVMNKCKLYRQSWLETFSLKVAAILNLI